MSRTAEEITHALDLAYTKEQELIRTKRYLTLRDHNKNVIIPLLEELAALTPGVLTGHQFDDLNRMITIKPNYSQDGSRCKSYSFYYDSEMRHVDDEIQFHDGPIDNGLNGITHEVLLVIMQHNLKLFQDGPYRCAEIDKVLQCITIALEHFKHRSERFECDRGKQSVIKTDAPPRDAPDASIWDRWLVDGNSVERMYSEGRWWQRWYPVVGELRTIDHNYQFRLKSGISEWSGTLSTSDHHSSLAADKIQSYQYRIPCEAPKGS